MLATRNPATFGEAVTTHGRLALHPFILTSWAIAKKWMAVVMGLHASRADSPDDAWSTGPVNV